MSVVYPPNVQIFYIWVEEWELITPEDIAKILNFIEWQRIKDSPFFSAGSRTGQIYPIWQKVHKRGKTIHKSGELHSNVSGPSCFLLARICILKRGHLSARRKVTSSHTSQICLFYLQTWWGFVQNCEMVYKFSILLFLRLSPWQSIPRVISKSLKNVSENIT